MKVRVFLWWSIFYVTLHNIVYGFGRFFYAAIENIYVVDYLS